MQRFWSLFARLLGSARVRLFLGAALAVLVGARLLLPPIVQQELGSGATSGTGGRAALYATATASAQAAQRKAAALRASLALHVAGNHLVTASGQPVVLRGVNRDGSDFLCAQGATIFDGPTGPKSIAAMLSWHINAVRIPLNEACWLGGFPGLSPLSSGPAYRSAIFDYVNALTAQGIYVVLDLHKAAPGNQVNAHHFEPAADADHAPAFWRSVASTFSSDGMVMFDLYNEPHGISWPCWRDGGAACANDGVPYRVAGMQDLLRAVRSTGASNVLLLTGNHWGNDLSAWLAYMPTDPLHNLAASWHAYLVDIHCANVACYDAVEGPLAAHVPLVAGEFGMDVAGQTCGGTASVDTFLAWLDAHQAGYLAWTWNVGNQRDCGSLALILDWSGTPHEPNGTAYRAHLLALPPALTR